MKTFQLIALFILNSSISMAQVPDYVPSNGLIGWWPLDGNAIDSSSNENHGLVDGATPTKDRFGLDNKALAFDGINDEVTFDVKQLLNFSISVWHKPIDEGDNYDPIFQLKKDCISTGYDRNGSAFMYTLKEDGKVKIAFRYMPRDCSTASAYFGGRIDNAYTTFNNWSHYVMTWNDTNKSLTIFHNGRNIVNNTVLINFNAVGNEILRLGKLHEGKNSIIWSSCLTDDLGFWDRVLDSNEVKALYLNKKCDSRFVINTRDTIISASEVSFTCELNDSNATYSWETNLGLGWTKLSNAGQYSSVKTKTLRVSNLSNTNNNQLFRCIAKSICGYDTTNEARLTITTSMIVQQSLIQLSVFPNPTYGIITVHGISKATQYELFSLEGKLLTSGETEGIINLTNLNSGIYYLRIKGIWCKIFKSEI